MRAEFELNRRLGVFLRLYLNSHNAAPAARVRECRAAENRRETRLWPPCCEMPRAAALLLFGASSAASAAQQSYTLSVLERRLLATLCAVCAR